MIKSNVLFLLVCLLFVNCKDDKDCLPTEIYIDNIDLCIPQCVDDLSQNLRSQLCQGSADLTYWEFNGQVVYCFFYGDCTDDSKAEIFDAECNLLCSLFGLSGNEFCQGIFWDGNAERLGTIYTY